MNAAINYYQEQAILFLNSLNNKHNLRIVFVDQPDIAESKIDRNGSIEIIFMNAPFFDGMSAEYALLIILHEIYHHVTQGIQSKNDVTYIRDHGLWEMMQLCDIEADIQVMSYMHQSGLIPSFEHYTSTLYQGAGVYRDNVIRQPKLERFIGAVVSVRDYFTTGTKTLYLPQLFYKHIMVVVIDFASGCVSYKNFELPLPLMTRWETVFQNAALMQEEHFTASLVELADTFISNAKQ